MEAPVLSILGELKERAWLHMPGHGGELAWLSSALDTTEIDASDDLWSPTPGGVFERAQALAAQAAGAGATVFLTGGSSQGIHAMITTFVPPGGKLILPRDAHHAALAACAIGDVRPVYVWPEVANQRAAASSHALIKALNEHPDAAAVFVTRPDYYGACLDLAPIAEKARAMGVTLLVDEAHGAHFPYGGSIASAGALGADAWVQSAHKTLPALTQAAYLHLRNPAHALPMRERAALLGTSSPSFLVAASLDIARAQMGAYGDQWIAAAHRRNIQLLRRVQRLGVYDAHEPWRKEGIECDATRIVMDVRATGFSGYELCSLLCSRGVDVEMADCYRLVALPPIAGNGQEEALAKLVCALEDIRPKGRTFFMPDVPLPRAQAVLTPRIAAVGPRR